MTTHIIILAAAVLISAAALTAFWPRVWRLRRRRLVRIHVERTDPGDGAWERDATVEGILLGRWAGHYVLARARWIDAEASSVSLAGDVEIPEGRVLFLQVLGGETR